MRKTPAPLQTPRVVLDTNVLISALLFARGRLTWLRAAWQHGELTPLASRAAVEELLAVLAYPKFKLTEAEREDILGDYLPFCETVQIPTAPSADDPSLPACRDADDQKFLILAATAGADALITGDKDLLALDGPAPFPILVPETFRQRFMRP